MKSVIRSLSLLQNIVEAQLVAFLNLVSVETHFATEYVHISKQCPNNHVISR